MSFIKDNSKKLLNKLLSDLGIKEYVKRTIKEHNGKIVLENLHLKAKIGFSCPENIPVLREFRDKRIIVSLTTFPQRDMHIETVIYSLLMQSTLPDKIILWLSNEEYPHGLDDVAYNIKVLTRYGVEIKFCKNIKSYKKLIPTLALYPDDIIVTVDDDTYYHPQWLKDLYASYLENPQFIHAHRVVKVTFNNDNTIAPFLKFIKCIDCSASSASFLHLATGVGGILYPPNSLYKDIAKEELFMTLSPFGDDIWFWAQALLQGTKTHIIENGVFYVINLNKYMQVPDLWSINDGQGQNDIQIGKVLEYYPDLIKKLLEEKNCTH